MLEKKKSDLFLPGCLGSIDGVLIFGASFLCHAMNIPNCHRYLAIFISNDNIKTNSGYPSFAKVNAYFSRWLNFNEYLLINGQLYFLNLVFENKTVYYSYYHCHY